MEGAQSEDGSEDFGGLIEGVEVLSGLGSIVQACALVYYLSLSETLNLNSNELEKDEAK